MNPGASWLYLATFPQRAARAHPWLANTCLAAAVLCVLAQLWMIQASVQDSALSRDAPVAFPATWKPDKTSYHPGEFARFSYQRSSSEANVLLLLLDSFENIDTGVSYEGVLLGKVVDHAGMQRMHAVRQIPWRISPGRYRLVGWVSPQTSKRSKPTGYTSEVFTVLSP